MRPTSSERTASQSDEARRQHRDAWLIVLGVGCVIILFGNLLGWGPWLVASLVAACMVLFGVGLEIGVDAADVPGDTKGDSIYYLGLLFTFAALVAALITFDWGTPGGDASGTTGSIRNFGIALLTTIVGLAGRVWFTMSQDSPGDIVDTTRSRLEETVSLMKESLDRARDDLDIMADKFRDSSAGLGEMAEIIAEGTRRTAETYGALDDYAGHVASASQSLTEEIVLLKTVCGTSARTLTTLQDRAGELGRRFGDVHARLADATGSLERINEVAGPAAERVDATLRGVESTNAAMAALGRTLSGVRGSAERATRALAGIADAVDRHEVLPLWRDAVEQLHTGTRGIRGIGEQASEMNVEFEGLKASAKAAREGLASVPGTARALNEQLREVAPELTGSIAPVRSLARDLNAYLAAAGEQSAELSGALEDARRQARGLSAEMREAAGVDTPAEPRLTPAGRIRRALSGMRRPLTVVRRALAGMRRALAGTRRALTRLPRLRRKS